MEKEIGKAFVEGEIPTPHDICTKQLYKVMDDIVKVDVNEEEIAPFMAEINRHFEYIDKEDIIKKMMSLEFGRFLAYYANAPQIEKPSAGQSRGERKKDSRKQSDRTPRQPEKGYRRLFINLGKADGFYPGEVMQYVNRHVQGRQEIGHIDLLSKFAYIEVPERDADKVMQALDGTEYKGREVRCNDADEGGHGRGQGRAAKAGGRSPRREDSPAPDDKYAKRSKVRAQQEGRVKPKRGTRGEMRMESGRQDDWRQFFQGHDIQLIGDEPDFSEEGWARRRPKKK